MSYAELLLLPTGKKIGSGTASKLQVDASYYRIRVDVGWEMDSAPNSRIKSALGKINKSFYLNMIDHEIDIGDDGSVTINVTYRAYIESALKGAGLNALASKDVNNKLSKIREEEDSELLHSIRRRRYAAEKEGEEASRFLVLFKVDNILPLIGPGEDQ